MLNIMLTVKIKHLAKWKFTACVTRSTKIRAWLTVY